MLTALRKLLLSRANPFADIKSDGAAAITAALSNLGFTYGTGWYKLGALIIQYGPIDFTGVTSRAVTFPIPFPAEVAR
ncbi:gp53-like domain-containing protein, partial [Propionibacterium freudenreichii]